MVFSLSSVLFDGDYLVNSVKLNIDAGPGDPNQGIRMEMGN